MLFIIKKVPEYPGPELATMYTASLQSLPGKAEKEEKETGCAGIYIPGHLAANIIKKLYLHPNNF